MVRRSLTIKIFGTLALTSFLIGALATSIQLYWDYKTAESEVEQQFNIVSSTYVDPISQALWSLDEAMISALLTGIVELPAIEYVKLQDNSTGKVFEAGVKSIDPIDTTFEVSTKRRDQNIHIGSLKVESSKQRLMEDLYDRMLFIVFINSCKAFVFFSVIYFVIRYRVLRRLFIVTDKLKEAIQIGPNVPNRLQLAIHEDNTNEFDEIDELATTIDQLRNSVQKHYTDLQNTNAELEQRVQEKTKAILEQRKNLEYASRLQALAEMAGGIAHEINNPLAIIHGRASQVRAIVEREGIDNPNLNKSLSSILETTDRIARIVSGLKSLARNGINDPLEEVNVGVLIKDALSLCSEKFKEAGIQIQFIPPVPPLVCLCRPTQVLQVLINLLQNAFDAVEGTLKPWIRIEAHQSRKYWGEIKVIDSGLGIPEENQEKIMQPFFTTKEIGKGTGLGLSISKGLAESQGGELALHPQEQNTTFILRLKLANLDQRQSYNQNTDISHQMPDL